MKRTATLAWGIFALDLLLYLAALTFAYLTRDVAQTSDFGSAGFVGVWMQLTFMLAFPLFGRLIASRVPRNPIGWICLTIGFFWFYLFFADGYGVFGLRADPGAVPAPTVVGAFGSWVPAVGLLGTFLLLLFPDGKLPSRRWRPVAWLSGVTIVIVTALVQLAPDGPLGNLGISRVVESFGPVFVLFPVCIVASLVSLVSRYRKATVNQRQQLKWIALAGVIFVIIYGVTIVLTMLFEGPVTSTDPSPVWIQILQSFTLASFALVPTAAWLAVLRYRLYDIDRIISRTLSYALVTVVLSLVYAVIALAPTAIAGTGGHAPSWQIAASTLVVAVLFRPVRRRVQDAVDHRFNRTRYDAVHAIQTFSARLRDELDLETLKGEIESVVQKTMQPTHSRLWLRQDS